jgi:hypothetical protein
VRRLAIVGFAVGLTAGLTACPGPSPTYQPPTVESIQVSPNPAAPGQTVTVVIDAHDDVAVTGATPNLVTTPNGARRSGSSLSCTAEGTPQEDQRHVVFAARCTVPTLALNGTWHLQIHLSDGPADPPPGWSPPDGTDVTAAFEVAGGSDDRDAPRLTDSHTTPTMIDQETTFSVTMRLGDASLPAADGILRTGSFEFAKLGASNSKFWCSDSTFHAASALEVDVTATCRPSNFGVAGRSETGMHRAVVPVIDALDNVGGVELFIDVQPAPA